MSIEMGSIEVGAGETGSGEIRLGEIASSKPASVKTASSEAASKETAARYAYRITPAERRAFPTSVSAMGIRWLETQGQDVLGHAILGAAGDPSREAERFLFWMVDQKLDRAIAVRLFWKLYRPELQFGPPPQAPDPAATTLAALKALLSRFELGSFPRGQTGIGRQEARYYRLSWRAARRAAAKAEAAFDIPKSLFQPQPGRMLEPQPTIRPVGPAPEWMNTPDETRFSHMGQRLRLLVGECSRAQLTRMQARIETETRKARLRYGAAAVVTAASLVIWTTGPAALALPFALPI